MSSLFLFKCFKGKVMRVLPIFHNREYCNKRVEKSTLLSAQSKNCYLKNSSKTDTFSFKSKNVLIKEPMNFKTKGLFLTMKELFEIKSNLLVKDIQLFQESLASEYSKLDIRLPLPILAISTLAYGNEFKFLRLPDENEPKYLMVVSGKDSLKKIEFKDNELIADFNSKEEGISLNEYVLLGLESQFQEIKNQENISKIEKDYKQRDNMLSEYVDTELRNLQLQINKLKKQVNNNSIDIKTLQNDVAVVNNIIKKLRKDLKTTKEYLEDSIHAVDTKYYVSVSPDWAPEYNWLQDLVTGGYVFPDKYPCWDFIKK